jgi:hypothetical protein
VRATIPRNRPSFRGRRQPEPEIQILAKKDWIPGSRCRASRNDQLSGKNCNDLILRSLRSRRLEGWPHTPWPVAVLRDARKSALLRTRSPIDFTGSQDEVVEANRRRGAAGRCDRT